MKTMVLLFHPDYDHSRVNRTLATALQKLNGVTVRNMYQEYPDGDINVVHEQKLLTVHERIVFQFPTYWYSSPSLLKKWEDLVLEHGWAYGSTGHALQGKELLIATSTGGGQDNYTPDGLHGYYLAELMRPFQSMAHMVGFKYARPFFTFGSRVISDERLADQAKRYRQYVSQAKPLPLLSHHGVEDGTTTELQGEEK